MEKTSIKILVVDDEEIIHITFRKVLQKPGAVVDTVHTKKEAISLLKSRTYRAVITDLRLSGTDDIDGVYVVRNIKRYQPSSCIIFVITAYGDPKIRNMVLDSGAEYYMEKPVSPKKIKKILESREVYR
jgi:two-component system response regulator PilR (NtrC family)